MPRKVQYVNITPIPAHIPRQLAIDMLHSHGEIIELNPLVLEHHPIKAPRDAPADEFFSVWHEITERIQYIPGMGKMGSGKISFKGVFHDIPLGLQTHIYAPAGVDMRSKYEVRGNQPGEPPEQRELGSGAPAEGLYLREEVEFKCNFSLVPFVKSQNKAACGTMINRMVKKAELIDSEILRQMMEAHNNAMANNNPGSSPNPSQSPGMNPGLQYSPSMAGQQPNRNTMLSNSDVLRRREESLRSSLYQSSGSFRNSQNNPGGHPSPGLQPPGNMMEMMGSVPQQYHNQSQGLAIEMMGDTQYNYPPQQQQPQGSPGLAPPGRHSTYSELDGGGSQSQFGSQLGSQQGSVKGGSNSRPSSIGPENMTTGMSSGWGSSQAGSDGHYSPRPGEMQQHHQQQQQQGGYRYNPRDFAAELPNAPH